jgi:hypothetical protein
VLNKETYIKIVEKAVKRDITNRTEFFKEFRIFKSAQQNKLEQLLAHAKLITVSRGHVMYRVGDKSDGVYLIKEGSFEVTRPTNINSMNTERLDKMNIDPIAKI